MHTHVYLLFCHDLNDKIDTTCMSAYRAYLNEKMAAWGLNGSYVPVYFLTGRIYFLEAKQ